MSTWSRRFGWIVPSWNSVTEFEVQRLAPPGVSQHFTRIAHTEDSPAAFDAMARHAPEAALLLAHASVDAICYACTSGSFFRGYDYDRDLATELTAQAGTPVVTMADALVQSARHLGMRRIAVAAPYEPWLLEALVSFLEAAGLRVLRSAGLGEQANVRHTPAEAVALARSAWDPAADGLVMSCGNFRTLEAIGRIERELGRPVVTSVQASVWAMCRATDAAGPRRPAGMLFRQPPVDPLPAAAPLP